MKRACWSHETEGASPPLLYLRPSARNHSERQATRCPWDLAIFFAPKVLPDQPAANRNESEHSEILVSSIGISRWICGCVALKSPIPAYVTRRYIVNRTTGSVSEMANGVATKQVCCCGRVWQLTFCAPSGRDESLRCRCGRKLASTSDGSTRGELLFPRERWKFLRKLCFRAGLYLLRLAKTLSVPLPPHSWIRPHRLVHLQCPNRASWSTLVVQVRSESSGHF
jgi:hypothetical protein